MIEVGRKWRMEQAKKSAKLERGAPRGVWVRGFESPPKLEADGARSEEGQRFESGWLNAGEGTRSAQD